MISKGKERREELVSRMEAFAHDFQFEGWENVEFWEFYDCLNEYLYTAEDEKKVDKRVVAAMFSVLYSLYLTINNPDLNDEDFNWYEWNKLYDQIIANLCGWSSDVYRKTLEDEWAPGRQVKSLAELSRDTYDVFVEKMGNPPINHEEELLTHIEAQTHDYFGCGTFFGDEDEIVSNLNEYFDLIKDSASIDRRIAASFYHMLNSYERDGWKGSAKRKYAECSNNFYNYLINLIEGWGTAGYTIQNEECYRHVRTQ